MNSGSGSELENVSRMFAFLPEFALSTRVVVNEGEDGEEGDEVEDGDEVEVEDGDEAEAGDASEMIATPRSRFALANLSIANQTV